MTPQPKPLLASKTFWLAVFQAVAGGFAIFVAQDPAVQSIGVIAVIKSFLDIALRFVTKAPIQ